MINPNLIYKLKKLVIRIQSKFKTKKIFANYLPAFALVVSIISMALVFFTLNEMQIARNNAYRPNLVFENSLVNLSWGNGIKNIYETNEEKLNPSSIPIKVYNIGVGTAKNVKIIFDIESADSLAETIEKTDKTDSFKYERTGKRIFLTVDGNRIMYAENYIWENQFILSDTQKENELYLPKSYVALLNRVFINSQNGNSDASIHLIIAYEDIQGKTYNEDVFLDCTPEYYENDSSNNGAGSYSIKSRIN